jgi:hypothetical protein
MPKSLKALCAVLCVGISCGCGAPASRPLVHAPAIGRDVPYHPAALSQAVQSGVLSDGLSCHPSGEATYGVHIEIFANQQTVVIPAGIGVAPPWKGQGTYVTGGRCVYAAHTYEPTGLVEVDSHRPLTLGQFFDLWGQPLTTTQLAGFTATGGGQVTAFVNGRPWANDPRLIGLYRHAEIVLELGGPISPHGAYRFPNGL